MNDQLGQPAGKSRSSLLISVGLIAVGGAAVLAALAAEWNIDPTGLGKRLGLTEIAEPGLSPELERGARRKGVLTIVTEPFAADPAQPSDQWEYVLEPFASIEMKYTLDEGATMLFDWEASKVVNYDLHAHPFDGGTELTESYGVGDAQHVTGRYVAQFTGVHGWYWQNRSSDNVTLVVKASGPLKESTIFGGGGETKRAFVPIVPAEATETPAP
jgi:hypothetical protein